MPQNLPNDKEYSLMHGDIVNPTLDLGFDLDPEFNSGICPPLNSLHSGQPIAMMPALGRLRIPRQQSVPISRLVGYSSWPSTRSLGLAPDWASGCHDILHQHGPPPPSHVQPTAIQQSSSPQAAQPTCHKCSKTFSRPDALKRYLKSSCQAKAGESEKSGTECNLCGPGAKVFPRRDHFYQHLCGFHKVSERAIDGYKIRAGKKQAPAGDFNSNEEGGVLPARISVMKTPRGFKDGLEPFFQETTEGGTWHEIGQLPLTEPKVSSLETSVYNLDQWEYDWVFQHGHEKGEYLTYGELDDEDRPYANEAKEDGSWEEDSDTEFLVKCCGQDRPLRKRGQKIVVTPSEGNHFVTVHDYLSTVHPWLMSLRPKIWLAKSVQRYNRYPEPERETWMMEVDQSGHYGQLVVWEKEDWVDRHSPPYNTREAAMARALERRTIRANRNM